VTSPVPATALDHQLVDITGVQVVWAADSLSRQWAARLGARGRRREAAVIRPPATAQSQGLPSPDRAIDWADLQTFVPRFTDPALPAEPDPAAAAGPVQVDWWAYRPGVVVRRF
jgi:hypothetical protein